MIIVAVLALLVGPSGGSAVVVKWNLTGSLSTARSGLTATLILGGTKVLAVGGSAQVPAAAELYDVALGSWTNTAGSLPIPRSGHTSTLLPSGDVFVAGKNDMYSFDWQNVHGLCVV